MNRFTFACIAASMALAAAAPACSDDPDDDNAGTSNSTSTTTSTGSSGDGGNGAGGSSANAGGGGSAPEACSTEAKEEAELSGSITEDTTLTADKDWILTGVVFVEAGATLTIEPCTTIKGTKDPVGVLVVEPGAKIEAAGEADKPIVFTSLAEAGERAAGDWGGVMLLGQAPINVEGGVANVEGIVGEGTEYGGDDADDDSGTLKYVRIEFSGVLLSPDNEVNGLTLAGVGRGTEIDHVQVHHTLDDCFEFFGGTVNAKHLVCNYNQDDGIDWDFGYAGKLQFVVVQQDPTIADDTNGFEGDNDADGSTNAPISNPTIYNATLVGKNEDLDKQAYGMLIRRSSKGVIRNLVATGFEAGLDVRDADTAPDIQNSIFFGNTNANIGYDETQTGDDAEPTLKDDDAGFDETAEMLAAGNTEEDPGLGDPYSATNPDFTPAETLTENAATPPDDGFFDASAAFVGAFAAGEDWTAEGSWVSHAQN